MTIINPVLAAAIADKGIPLSADMAAQGTEREAELRAEIARLRVELDSYKEHLAFLERSTLPELRRTIQHHEDGKKRWRDRAEKAEPERDALRARLHQAALAKVWTNEDGKKFMFAEDIAGPVCGIEPKAGESR